MLLPREKLLGPPLHSPVACRAYGPVRLAILRDPAEAICGELPAREGATKQTRVGVHPEGVKPPSKRSSILARQRLKFMTPSGEEEAAPSRHRAVTSATHGLLLLLGSWLEYPRRHWDLNNIGGCQHVSGSPRRVGRADRRA